MKSESGQPLIKLTLPRDYQPGGQGRSAACGNTRPTGPRDARATEAASHQPHPRNSSPRKLSRLRRPHGQARRDGFFLKREALSLLAICALVFVAFAWPWLAQMIGGAL